VRLEDRQLAAEPSDGVPVRLEVLGRPLLVEDDLPGVPVDHVLLGAPRLQHAVVEAARRLADELEIPGVLEVVAERHQPQEAGDQDRRESTDGETKEQAPVAPPARHGRHHRGTARESAT
jgi:hypothetical protein